MNYEIHHGGNSLNNVANLHVLMSVPNSEFFEVLLPDGAQKYGLVSDIEVDGEGIGRAIIYSFAVQDREGNPLDIDARVVSLPCWELFMSQDDDYKAAVLGDVPTRTPANESAVAMTSACPSSLGAV